MPNSSHRPLEYKNLCRVAERVQTSQEAREVGEPYVTKDPTRLSDTTLTCSEGSHEQSEVESGAKLTPGLAEGTITVTDENKIVHDLKMVIPRIKEIQTHLG